MPATSKSEESNNDQITDDISNTEVKDNAIDTAKLAVLKAKSQAKQQEVKMAAKIVSKKERSINLGVLGSGQGGSRLAESFFKLGYDTVAINTAIQDLKHIDIPDSNKLLLEYGVGGASKELTIGKEAAESHRGEILQLVNDKLADSQVNVLCFSLGGGSGAGSCETLIDIFASLGKPVVVITILPMDTEDVQAKANSLETLAKLATFARTKKISNLIVVDNAKIESIYRNANQFDFFALANKAIVETLDVFNTLSCTPSAVKGLDPMEFSKILMDGEGLSVYGEFVVDNYGEDTAIAEAVVNNLNNNLLASGFDLKQAKYVGFIVAASKTVWDKIPASSVNYATAMVNDLCGSPQGVFKGVYTIETPDNNVKVYSFFSGLSLPEERIKQLKDETAQLQSKNKGKSEQRNLSLQLDTGVNEAVSTAQAIKNKIAAKSSTFGKFVSGTVTDRRK
jgi:cell division GTPase FtsZ